MTELQIALKTIQKEINFICEHMDSFIAVFCFGDTFDVYGISFDAYNVRWVSITNKDGCHLKNECTIAQYLRWKDKVNESNQMDA